MIARFVQDGKAIDYRPTEAVAAGSVIVQSGLVGVARLDIAAGTLGSLATTGVFEVAKTASENIPAGAAVFFNASTHCATLSSTGSVYMGKAIAASAATADTVHVLINAGGAAQSTQPQVLKKLTDQSGGTASETVPSTDMGSRDAVATLAAKLNAVIELLQSLGWAAEA